MTKTITTAPLPRQEVPKGARLKAADAGTWKLQAGPNSGSEHPKGLARAALEVEAYLRQRRISLRLRLRPEGLPPEEIYHDFSSWY